jgi:hypothetical protein
MKEFESLIALTNKDDPILFHLTIGAAMEEHQKLAGRSEYDFQWQQLFPFHIRRFIKENPRHKRKIIHFIVSPNEHFAMSDDIPFFVQKTPEFEWEIVGKTYYSKKFNYEVHIFCTMMPTIDLRNGKILDQLEKFSHLKDLVGIYRQTIFDREFTEKFYDSIDNMIGQIIKHNGIATCFSFAVFNASGNNEKLKNFVMFPEITKIFDGHMCILAEWTYRVTCYVLVLRKPLSHTKLIQHSSSGSNDNPCLLGLSYVEPITSMSDGYQIVISDEYYRLTINLTKHN